MVKLTKKLFCNFKLWLPGRTNNRNRKIGAKHIKVLTKGASQKSGSPNENDLLSSYLVNLSHLVNQTTFMGHLLCQIPISCSLATQNPFKRRIDQPCTVVNSSFPTRFLPLTVSVIVRVRGKLVRLELEETC